MIKTLKEIIKDNIDGFSAVVLLSKAMLRKRHKTSDLGWLWAIARPMMYITMFYFAVITGFRRAADIPGIVTPYYIWIASGISAWFFIQDLIVGGASCFRRHKSLLLRSKFPRAAIPMISVLSYLYVHCIIVAIVAVLAMISGAKPNLCWLQLPLYIALSVLFTYVWSFLTGMLSLLSNDLIELIQAIKPAFFWLSGILFNSRTSDNIIFVLNPITFLVEGYRNSLCYNMWIWEDTRALAGFAAVFCLLIMLTVLIYKRLKWRLSELV